MTDLGSTSSARVLTADDSDDIRELLAMQLRREGLEVIEAADGEQALAAVRQGSIDVVLLDVDMPGLSGFEVLGAMQEDVATANIPVLMLTAQGESELVTLALDAGAHDYVVKPFNAATLMARVRAAIRVKRQRDEMTRASNELSEMALTDVLTGLANRASAEQVLRLTVAGAKRSGHPFTLLMVDVDHFKRVNDTFGHDIGDEVLREVGARLGAAVRESDLVSRWGGEEFLVVLPRMGAEGASIVAERMLELVRHTPVSTAGGPVAVSVSIGIATGPNTTDTAKMADVALYDAKRSGRNRASVYVDGRTDFTA